MHESDPHENDPHENGAPDPQVPSDPAEPLFRLLESLGIQTKTVCHEPVFTVEAAKQVEARPEGTHVKNLFLRTRKGDAFLLTTLEDRRVDLQALADLLQTRGLSFGSAERLRAALGVEPGSVTPLAAMNDRTGSVTVVLDADVLRSHLVCCHPLTNDRTTTIGPHDLVRFLRATGHEPRIVELVDRELPDARGADPLGERRHEALEVTLAEGDVGAITHGEP